MRTRRRSAIGCGLLAIAIAACDAAPPPPPPALPAPAPPLPVVVVEDGSLEGTLYDAGGDRTLSGRVVVTAADGRTWSDQAGLDGWFHVRGLPRGEWVSLEASAAGVATRKATRLEVPLVGAGQTGPLRMAPTGALRVLVADESGAPVAGAAVAVRRPLDGNLLSGPIPFEPWPEAARATTAADGSAVVKDLPPGKWALRVSAPGRARSWELFEHAGGNEVVPRSVVLRPGHSLEGRLHLPGGEPAAGAVVAALEWGARASASMSCITTTADGEGRFRLDGLRPGHHPILVRAFPGVIEPAGTVEVPAATPQDLWLGPRAAMEGVVSDRDRPVAGAIVRWVVTVPGTGWDSRIARVEVRTDATGCYRVPHLPAGDVDFFKVRAAGFLPYPDSFTPREMRNESLVQGRTLRADAALHRGAVVRGFVRDLNGVPVRNAWVQVDTEAENRFCAEVPTAWTDAKGAYLFPSAHPGKAALRSGGSGRHSRDDGSCAVTVPGEGEVVKDLVLIPDARVRGHVRLADGTPAAGFLPRVVTEPMEDGYEPTVAKGARTSESGEFHMWVDRPGKGLRVVADGPGGLAARSEPFDLEAGQF
ncbi:MAG TPA: carboxypeptidase-like regulatory domain-containing protein, partial [Planctomycetota bacterium]|nr:carboxypeptidase-like regulatory domain-containing protein [Planctomycetota bacterium]